MGQQMSQSGFKLGDFDLKAVERGFEVMPATPRDHDKNAINVMKTGKLSRIERSYEARKKTGWMETIQVPLISDDGLIEGMVGLSFETSERKKKEGEILNQTEKL